MKRYKNFKFSFTFNRQQIIFNILILLIGMIALIPREIFAPKVIPDAISDDAYTTLRYARNLSNGLGFVYNPGERVCGTTTPLFTLLLAIGGKIMGTAHIEALSVWSSIIASLLFLAVMVYIFRLVKLDKGVFLLSLLCIALLPAFTGSAISGMETSLVLLLMSLSLVFYFKNRWYAIAIICGLLINTRIDTIIWCSVLFAHIVIEEWSRIGNFFHRFWISIIIFFAIIAPWFLFAIFYFGTVIPQSLIGKAVSHGAFQPLSLEYIKGFAYMYLPPYFSPIGWIILFIFLGIGGWHLWKEKSELRPVITFFVAYNLIFMLARAPVGFLWLFVPVEWIFYLLLWSGVCGILNYIKLHFIKFSVLLRPLAWSIITAGIISYSYFHRSYSSRSQAFFQDSWDEISNFLNTYTTLEARIFAGHIGSVGYSTNRYIYDPIGLITPEIIEIKRNYGTSWLIYSLKKFKPDVVILYLEELPGFSPYEAQWLNQNYTLMATYVPFVNIYFCKDSPYVRFSSRKK